MYLSKHITPVISLVSLFMQFIANLINQIKNIPSFLIAFISLLSMGKQNGSTHLYHNVVEVLKTNFNQLVFFIVISFKEIIAYLCKCFFPQILNMSPKQSPMNGLTPRLSTLSSDEYSQWTVYPRGTITRRTSSSPPGPSSQPRKPPSQSRPSVRGNRFLLCVGCI